MKLWKGRFSKEVSDITNDFNASIGTDARMIREDITGSIAHATMLADCGIITPEDRDAITDGLRAILAEVEDGRLPIDEKAEDVHTFVEGELTKRVGDAGKRLHTARSRNDQVALDVRLHLRGQTAALDALLKKLIGTLCDMGEAYADAVMAGYTHLQRAQPVSFGHYMLAYGEMLLRDRQRLADCVKRMNINPLGACALAGTTYPTDRFETARLLGMDGVSRNSLDAVSDRDFIIELSAALSIVMVHLSRFSEEIILWCSTEFGYIELDDAFATGSSIMPQKKNPDIPELVRGKAGRVFGDLMTILTVMKGLPLAYNKDMQEDKDCVFDAVDTVKACLTAFIPMLETMTVKTGRMRAGAAAGFINATDCADYLVGKGIPFRDAYAVTGALVARCIELGTTLEALPLDEYLKACDRFDEGVYTAVGLEKCLADRRSYGGPAKENVLAMAQALRGDNENTGA